jgi:hypothetical protein
MDTKQIYINKKNYDILLSVFKKNCPNINLIILEKSVQKAMILVSDSRPIIKNNENKDEVILELNKKVVDLLTPLIKSKPQKNIEIDIQKNIKKNIQPDNRLDFSGDNISGMIFDKDVYGNNTVPGVMEYPKIQDVKSNLSIENIEKERKVLDPVVKNINFQEDTNETPTMEDISKLFDQLVNNRNESDIKNLPVENSSLNNLSLNNLSLNNSSLNNSLITTPQNQQQQQSQTKRVITNSLYNTGFKDQKSTDIENILNEPINNISPDFGPAVSSLNSVILPPKYNLITNTIYIIIDSQDRNFATYPFATNFQVKFSPTGDSITYDTFTDKKNNILYETKTIYYGDRNAQLPDVIDNINKIICTSSIIPTLFNYVGGRNPVKFVKATTELPTPAQYQNYYVTPFEGKFTESTGIPISIFNEPYLLLNIEELQNTYYGTNTQSNNAFAKLTIPYANNNLRYNIPSKFIECKTTNVEETLVYSPILQGKLDKMTLKLNNKNGKLMKFGYDVLYIESISRGTLQYANGCNQFYNTKLKIAKTNKYYLNYCKQDTINSHSVCPGDLLYLYSTIPRDDSVIYFSENVHIINIEIIDKLTDNPEETEYIKLSMHFCTDLNELKERKNKNQCGVCNQTDLINFQDIFPKDNSSNCEYYIYLIIEGDSNFYKVYGFDGEDIILKVNKSFNINSQINGIGFTKSNTRGYNTDDENSLFSNNGYHVTSVGNMNFNGKKDNKDDDQFWNIEIDYPYEYIKNKNIDDGDIFLVQQKLQISYTFKVEYLVKNYEQLNSQLN